MKNVEQASLVAGCLLAAATSFAQTEKRDWAQFSHYAETNKTMKVLSNMVFIRNSITDGRQPADSTFFIRNNFVSRRTNGQTASETLVRFCQDVINLKPKAVVTLAGINDIAHNNGVIALEDVFGNLVSMAESAKADHIKVIFCSILPAYDLPWRPGMQPADKIIQLNKWIKEYADENGLTHMGYHSVMKGERNGLPVNLSRDSVHPTLEGYKIVEKIVLEAIHRTVE